MIPYYFHYRQEFFGLLNKNCKIKDVKKVLNKITGIKMENIKYQIFFDFSAQENDEKNFWGSVYFKVYDISKFNAVLSRHVYSEDVILDLNYNVGQLKKQVYQQTKIPIDR